MCLRASEGNTDQGGSYWASRRFLIEILRAITVDSGSVVRNHARESLVPFSRFLPTVAFCKVWHCITARRASPQIIFGFPHLSCTLVKVFSSVPFYLPWFCRVTTGKTEEWPRQGPSCSFLLPHAFLTPGVANILENWGISHNQNVDRYSPPAGGPHLCVCVWGGSLSLPFDVGTCPCSGFSP